MFIELKNIYSVRFACTIDREITNMMHLHTFFIRYKIKESQKPIKLTGVLTVRARYGCVW